jgi:hypothetical protein
MADWMIVLDRLERIYLDMKTIWLKPLKLTIDY